MLEVLFQLGPLTFRTFNLFLAIAFVVTMYVLVKLITRSKMNLPFLVHHFIYLLIFPLIIGRIFYVFEHLSAFMRHPLDIFFVWDLKFSTFGALYGFIATLYFYTDMNSEDFWEWFDNTTLAGLAGLVFVHLGHFFNGSNYGKPTELPFGIAFDNIAIPFTSPIHPTQLYAALLALLVYGIAMKYNKRIHLSGMVATLALVIYSLGAFSLEFLHGLSSSYIKGNYLFIAATAFVAYIHTSHKSHPLSNK